MAVNTKGYRCLACDKQLYFTHPTNGHIPRAGGVVDAIMKCNDCNIIYNKPEVLKVKKWRMKWHNLK